MHIFCFKLSFKLYHDNKGYQEKLRESEPLRCHEFLGFCEDGRGLSQNKEENILGWKDIGGSSGFQVERKGVKSLLTVLDCLG